MRFTAGAALTGAALAAVLVVFAASESIHGESGLLAVTIMGIWLANTRRLDLEEILSEVLIEGGDPENTDDVAAIEAFEEFVESQGLAVEDFVLGNASAFDFEAETGVLVAGARTTDPEVTPDL